MLAIEYDAMANAAYIRLSKEAVSKTVEIATNIIFDYDRSGKIVGMEVLDARAQLTQSTLDAATKSVVREH